MTQIDQTIATLLADQAPARPAFKPGRAFMLWLAVTLAASGALLGLSDWRADLATQLQTPLYLAEVGTLALLILTTALAALWLGYPDLRQRPWPVYAPWLPLALYAVLEFYRQLHPALTTVLPDDQDNGWDCVCCITMYALVPAGWMFYTLRRNATTQPRLAGGLSLLLAASIGLLVLKFVEGNDDLRHQLPWHILPILCYGALGGWLGQKFLRW